MQEIFRKVDRLRDLRKNIIDIAIIAMIISIGANIISDLILDTFEIENFKKGAAGLLFIIFGVSIAFFREIPKIDGSFVIKGVLPVLKNNELLKIKRYKFSEQMKHNVDALNLEVKSLKKIWEERKFFDIRNQNGSSTFCITEAGELSVEAIEYYVLKLMSINLGDYFNAMNLDDKLLSSFKRKDIASIFVGNRMLDALSRPMSERDVFFDMDDVKHDDTVCTVFGANGIIYNKIDLKLPRGSKIERIAHGKIKFHTKKMSILFEVLPPQFSAFVESEFCSNYMGIKFSDVNFYHCGIKVNVSFNRLQMLLPSGWKQYEWLDGFISKLYDSISFEKFKKEIGFDTALTSLIIAENTIITTNNDD